MSGIIPPAQYTNGLLPQAVTPVAGFALTGATPTILSWTAPSDGKQHRVQLFASIDVTSAETGGAVGLTITTPDGTVSAPLPVFAAGLAAGAAAGAPLSVVVKAGSAVTLAQTSALTLGAAVTWAELWGS
jgi:hypothetical protein